MDSLGQVSQLGASFYDCTAQLDFQSLVRAAPHQVTGLVRYTTKFWIC